MANSNRLSSLTSDREDIIHLLQNWIYFRDHGKWDDLRATFHPEGTIRVSWFEGPFAQFVDASIKMALGNQIVKHSLGMPFVTVRGNRAVSDTNVTIMVRGRIGPTEADMTSYARLYDFLEKHEGKWRIVKRTCIFEKDRIDPVKPSLRFWITSLFTNFKKYPLAYRYIAYTAEKTGHKVSPHIVADKSQEAESLCQEGEEWLST